MSGQSEMWFQRICDYAELFGYVKAVIGESDTAPERKVELVRARIAEFEAKERRTDEPDGSQP